MSKQRRLPGFSLLELMIATVLGSMLLMTAAAMFMTFMVGNASTNARRQLSAEGKQVMSTIEYHLRNARAATCTNDKTIVITTVDSKSKSICVSGEYIYFDASSAACTQPNNQLNSNFVIVPDASRFTCTTHTNGKTTININLGMSVRTNSTIQETFSSIIILRNS
jgi:prepilin-type N-terminal cleavage/methylation domain-containing protein